MAKKISSGTAVWTSFFVDLGDIILNVIVMLATGSTVMLAVLENHFFSGH